MDMREEEIELFKVTQEFNHDLRSPLMLFKNLVFLTKKNSPEEKGLVENIESYVKNTENVVEPIRLETEKNLKSEHKHSIDKMKSAYVESVSSLFQPTNQMRPHIDRLVRLFEDNERLSTVTKNLPDTIEHIEGMLEEYIAYLKGDETLNLRYVPIEHVANYAVEFAKRFYDGKIDHIRFEESLNGYKMCVDVTKMRRVLSNLVKNSVEAIKDSGADSGLVKIYADEDGHNFHLYVEDNGPGIPDHVNPIEPGTTTKGYGTGRGVSGSYDRIKEHGGDLRYESKIGEGTTFIITLPKYS